MLRTLGIAVARHRLISLMAWALVLAACIATALAGVTGESLFQRLGSSGPSVEGEAADAAGLLEATEGTETRSLSLLAWQLDIASPGLATILADTAGNAAAVDGVTDVVNPLAVPPLPDGTPNPAVAPLFAGDGEGLLLNVSMESTDGKVNERVLAETLDVLNAGADDIRALAPDATVEVGGGPLIADSLVAVAESDLQKGELIALPIALFVMLIIFGGFLAAGIPLIGSIASIVGALGALYAFTFVMDIDITTMNVITVIGLGLSIDYGLLIVSRFREEFRALVARAADSAELGNLDRHELMLQAVGATVDTAGRTVLYSGVTFAVATAGLLVFEPNIIRAIAVGAVSVVLIAILTALVLVPALLGYFGERLLRPGLLTRIPGLGPVLSSFGDVAPREGVFSKLARGIQRSPVLVAVAGVAGLLLLGSPALSINVANTSSDVIPTSSTQYTFLTTLGEQFPLASAPRVQLVSDTDEAGARAWADRVAGLEHVTSVAAPRETNGYWVSGVSVEKHRGSDVVREIRADRPDFPAWAGGRDAASVDYVDSLVRGAPWAALIIVVATFVLLFLMTGSVIIPLTALVISVVSLGAAVGVLVWGFQEGNLAGLLGFNAADIAGVDALVLTLVLTFGFGLAMDYEMFLLARIKEHYERGESTRRSIETGLQSSGRIITSAGLIIVLVFAGFATGELMQMKQIGVALSVAVLLDATLVRTLVVPAVMTSLERSLWWAPRWMRPIHARFGLRE